MRTETQAPGAVIDYSIDLADNVPDGATIASVEWSADDGINIVDGGLIGTTATVRVSGGELSRGYRITLTPAYDDGQVDPQSFVVRIER